MKAVRMHEYGGPEVIVCEEVPRPEPAADEVMIHVQAAGVNPVDWKIREGFGKEWFGHQLPLTLGCDLAGVVESTGNKVTALKPGDAVYGYVNLARCGAYAQYAIARESEVALKPQTLDFIQAAAVPVGALTSWQALFDIAKLTSGQKVLIHAAAGGVGHLAVQLAKAKGAIVIGTISAKNTEFVRGLGVDQLIDYRATRFENEVEDVDVVFDTIGEDTQVRSFKVLKRGGGLVSAVCEPPEDNCKRRGVRCAMVAVQPNADQLVEISALIDSGQLSPTIATSMPLENARQAHEMSQSGHTRGKITLTI
jgi:NADPH:quinone reductase-like Zn-dependent oxidoreductase